MLDDGDYIVIGKLIPEEECCGKDIQRCYVSFTYVMIGTYTHAHTRTSYIESRCERSFFTKTNILSRQYDDSS